MALKDKLMTLEDFKAVRDVDVASNSAQFTEIKADLGAVGTKKQASDYVWNIGYIKPDGTNGTSTVMCRLHDFVHVSAGDVLVFDGISTYLYQIFFYSSNVASSYTGNTEFDDSVRKYTIENDCYIRINVKNNPSHTMTSDDRDRIAASIYFISADSLYQDVSNLDARIYTNATDIADMRADLSTLIKYGALDLNLSNMRAAYPAYVVNSAPTLTNSKTTLTFLNALKVEKGKKYTLKMTNGASPASTSSKHSVIVADNKVVQAIETAGTAGAEVELEFEPVADGDLYIVVDCLFASLEIDGRIEESKETETAIPKAVKTALLDCLEEYAYSSTTGRTAFNALRNALGVLDNLNVTYTQSDTVYDSDTLDTIKSDLTVEAVYIDGTTETVTDYTLSGNLTAGTSKIMVSYLGMSKEISVTVTAKTALYHWNFKESLIDTVANKEFTINTTLNALRSSLGLFYWGYREGVGTCAEAKVPLGGKAVIKFGAVEFVEGGNNGNGTIISGVIGYAWRGQLSRYAVYNGSWSTTGVADKPINYLSGKTLILSISSTGNVEINVDGEVVAEITAGLSEPYQIAFGETTARQTFRNMVIESLSIYGA